MYQIQLDLDKYINMKKNLLLLFSLSLLLFGCSNKKKPSFTFEVITLDDSKNNMSYEIDLTTYDWLDAYSNVYDYEYNTLLGISYFNDINEFEYNEIKARLYQFIELELLSIIDLYNNELLEFPVDKDTGIRFAMERHVIDEETIKIVIKEYNQFKHDQKRKNVVCEIYSFDIDSSIWIYNHSCDLENNE